MMMTMMLLMLCTDVKEMPETQQMMVQETTPDNTEQPAVTPLQTPDNYLPETEPGDTDDSCLMYYMMTND